MASSSRLYLYEPHAVAWPTKQYHRTRNIYTIMQRLLQYEDHHQTSAQGGKLCPWTYTDTHIWPKYMYNVNIHTVGESLTSALFMCCVGRPTYCVQTPTYISSIIHNIEPNRMMMCTRDSGAPSHMFLLMDYKCFVYIYIYMCVEYIYIYTYVWHMEPNLLHSPHPPPPRHVPSSTMGCWCGSRLRVWLHWRQTQMRIETRTQHATPHLRDVYFGYDAEKKERDLSDGYR